MQSTFMEVTKGVPQGSILGPLLFTLYINNIVSFNNGCKAHFYADDTVIYSSAPTLGEATAILQTAFNEIQRSLLELKLVLNGAKTKYMQFSRSRTLTDTVFNICTLDGSVIERVPFYKYLGIFIDEKLSFKMHITELSKKLRVKLVFFYRNKSCFSWDDRKLLVQSTFMSVIDYGDIIYMHAGSATLRQLDTVYHSALRFITGDHFRTHHCTLYQAVGWPSLTIRRTQHLLMYVYKAILGKLPSYLTSLITWRSSHHHTRSQDWLVLAVPQVRTDLGKSAFSYSAPRVWNEIQETIRLDTLVPLGSFKNLIKDTMVVICTCF